jgi:hypothetical protein
MRAEGWGFVEGADDASTLVATCSALNASPLMQLGDGTGVGTVSTTVSCAAHFEPIHTNCRANLLYAGELFLYPLSTGAEVHRVAGSCVTPLFLLEAIVTKKVVQDVCDEATRLLAQEGNPEATQLTSPDSVVQTCA